MSRNRLIIAVLVCSLAAGPVFALDGITAAQYTGETVDAVSSASKADGEWSSSPGAVIHRFAGYATLAGAILTGISGWTSPGSLHETAAYATTGLAAATTGVGVVTYARDGTVPLGHVILSGLGTVGFAANLLIEPEDDTGALHRWLGTAATGAFALSVVWVIAF